MPTAPAIAPEALARLAQELGWGEAPSEADAAALTLLLDDELERLRGEAGAAFRARFADSLPPALARCPHCGHLFLRRFRPEDGACRVCAGSLGAGAGPSEAEAAAAAETQRRVTAEAVSIPEVTWALGGAAPRARRVRIDPDNLDWDARLAEVERLREQRRAEAERLRREAEERRRREEEERRRREEEERLIREKHRPALGCVYGAREGHIIRIDDLPPEGPGEASAVWMLGEEGAEEPVLFVGPAGPPAAVDGQPVGPGQHSLAGEGRTVSLGDELFSVDETAELPGLVPAAIHFARDDKRPGGPWPYWNEEITIGAAAHNAVQVVDDGVDDVHAVVRTRFGRVVLEDRSSASDGLWAEGERRTWLLLRPGAVFRLSKDGPPLQVKKGDAKVKAGAKARAMKPSRHKRTVLLVRDAEGTTIRKVFVFTRRELRFGSCTFSPQDPTRMVNELTLLPALHEAVKVGEKQGSLAITRHGMDIRRDGGAPMRLDEEALEPGQPRDLKRRFEVVVGENMGFHGRVYRSPVDEEHTGPAQLGMKGGHSYECVRLDREGTRHSYVFLVRMLRIGSEPSAPLRLEASGVEPQHCQIMFSGGKFLIVAPKASAPVRVGDVDLDPGQPLPLPIDTNIHIGEATLRFRVVDESDWKV